MDDYFTGDSDWYSNFLTNIGVNPGSVTSNFGNNYLSNDDLYKQITGADTGSSNPIALITKLLSGTGEQGKAGQLAGVAGLYSLINALGGGLGQTGQGVYKGYQGGIPNYTATRTMNPIPQTVNVPAREAVPATATTPAVSAAPAGTAPRRPGSGGITYFTDMKYTPVTTAAPTTTPAVTAAPTVTAAAGGVMRMKDGGSTTPPETVEQWASRQPDLTNVVDPMARKVALESWQMQRPGYVNPMNYDTYEQYAGAANIKDEGGGSGQDLTNRANFYGMTTENYQNALSNDQTKPMGQYQSVYGNELLSPIEQIAAQTARAQGIGSMSPQVAALAKANPDVFNAASKKFNDFFTKTYPGTLEYQSVLSGPAQYSSTGVKMPAIDDSASMYILDKATGKIIKNPNYKKKMAGGGIANLGGYSDGGRLLRGPGDGVSDSIPATIGGKQPARLADGEFVIPARIVSEIGNGSTEAGAKKLYAMMDRIQGARKKSIKNVAANTKADKYLPK